MAASRKRSAVSERGTIEQAIAIIGLPIRTVQGMLLVEPGQQSLLASK